MGGLCVYQALKTYGRRFADKKQPLLAFHILDLSLSVPCLRSALVTLPLDCGVVLAALARVSVNP
jgi:hypothetical protein